MGDTVDALARLHAAGVNVLAFDYRGYGQSQFARPSEARWLQDAGWALQYLRETRHIASDAIILDGSGLGANLALEFCRPASGVGRPDYGVSDLAPMQIIFSDPRALPRSLLTLLVRDRFDLDAAAPALRIPSLWFLPATGASPVARRRLCESRRSRSWFGCALKRIFQTLHTYRRFRQWLRRAGIVV